MDDETAIEKKLEMVFEDSCPICGSAIRKKKKGNRKCEGCGCGL